MIQFGYMEKMRGFIAVNLPEGIKLYLKGVLEKLQNNNPSGIKWVKPNGLHITLHFLGYLVQRQLDDVLKIIQNEVEQKEELQLELVHLDAFPNLERPRVFFVACRELNNGHLKQLQQGIGNGLEKIGLKIDHRPWQPHITLGRTRLNFSKKNSGGQAHPNFLSGNLSGQVNIKNLRFEIKSIELMKSELTPAGAKYSVIKSFPIT